MMSKRIRGRNFTGREREVLFALVNNYRTILDNKKNDVKSNREKAHIWEIITRTFNSRFPENDARKPENLKMCYDNHRKRKKSFSMDKVDGEKADLDCEEEDETIGENLIAFKTETECLPNEERNSYDYYLGMEESTQQETSGMTESVEGTAVASCETEMPDTALEYPTISGEITHAVDREPLIQDTRRRKKQATSDLEDFILNRTKRRTTKEQFEAEQHDLKMKILNFDYESKVEQHKLKMTILETELKLKLKELNRYS